MNTWMVVVVIALLAAVAVIISLTTRWRRSHQLRSRFGPEYERAKLERGSRSRAEAELLERRRRVEHLHIHPLETRDRARYVEQWRNQQARFVDDPVGAVGEADHLVEEVMRARGYPVGDFDQKAADLWVDHPDVVENYRAAHELALRSEHGHATTDDLRNAMIYLRNLFDELLEDRPRMADARS